MLDPDKPRTCGVCGKRRKVYGFTLCRKHEYRKHHYLYMNILLEGTPRLCRECNNKALTVLYEALDKFIVENFPDEKTKTDNI